MSADNSAEMQVKPTGRCGVPAEISASGEKVEQANRDCDQNCPAEHRKGDYHCNREPRRKATVYHDQRSGKSVERPLIEKGR
jgi:hypothetical protein